LTDRDIINLSTNILRRGAIVTVKQPRRWVDEIIDVLNEGTVKNFV